MFKYTLLSTAICALFSINVHSQNLTFKQCSQAVDSFESYATAHYDITEKQQLAGEISPEKLAQLSQEITDYRDLHTMERCMANEQPHIYTCLITNDGDWTACWQ